MQNNEIRSMLCVFFLTITANMIFLYVRAYTDFLRKAKNLSLIFSNTDCVIKNMRQSIYRSITQNESLLLRQGNATADKK
jgi:hypothetical protein